MIYVEMPLLSFVPSCCHALQLLRMLQVLPSSCVTCSGELLRMSRGRRLLSGSLQSRRFFAHVWVAPKINRRRRVLHACIRCSRSRLQEESPYTHVWGAHFSSGRWKSGRQSIGSGNTDLRNQNSAKIHHRRGQFRSFSDNLKKTVAAGKVSPFLSFRSHDHAKAHCFFWSIKPKKEKSSCNIVCRFDHAHKIQNKCQLIIV